MGKDLLAVLLGWGVRDTVFDLASAQEFWKVFWLDATQKKSGDKCARRGKSALSNLRMVGNSSRRLEKDNWSVYQ